MFKYKFIKPLFTFLILISILLSFPSFFKTPITDFLKFPLKISNFVFSQIKDIFSYRRMKREIIELEKELSKQKAKLIKADELLKENQRLKRMLAFKESSRLSLLAASVIARDPSNWSSSVIIDRGRKDKIQEGQIVITHLGLVGKVLEVGRVTSKVILLNDANFSIAVLVKRNREQGILKGTLSGHPAVSLLSSHADIRLKDSVITSGLGGNSPKGILVGDITEIEGEGLYRRYYLKPAVRLSALEEVLVIVSP